MIQKLADTFVLQTKKTTYGFRVLKSGHLEHLYYGKRIRLEEGCGEYVLSEKHTFGPGNTIDGEDRSFSLEDLCLELSSYGKGDIREPFLELRHEDGSVTSDFLYTSYEIKKGKEPFKALPGSYDELDEVDHLCVKLTDASYELELLLHYYVYEACDVITRSVELCNKSKQKVTIERILSNQIDFDYNQFHFTTFGGAWAREMKRNDVPAYAGKFVNASYTGTSSSRANPFVMLSKNDVTQDYGEVYGFNFIYSGNHYACVEVSGHGKTRFVQGINPQSFSYLLLPDESFEAPEAVMTFSSMGFNGMSQNMHAFVREHIVRGEWKDKVRPVLLNSWEAAYFDINEKKLVSLAKAGKEVGIELFVMDDGWFGTRDDDTQSLGDWEVNKKKLPNGLSGLCQKINDLGLMFGIWVEPEMVNVKSNLYAAHPDWVMAIPDKPHAEGRSQRILDLTNPVVQDFIISKMSEVFASANISYVKWDMNRIVSDLYSPSLSSERQGEVMHRYQLGLYRCLEELTRRFPHILFEGCSSGGNRFDLGMLCYFPQIWASDDTDAVCRSEIQTGYSYGYPMQTVSAHVSAVPNHQTLRLTPLETRYHVACFGSFGYECNLCDMKKEDLDAIRVQIALYKRWREVLQTGAFYRGRTASDGQKAYISESVLAKQPGNVTEWTCVSKDQRYAVGFLMQKLVVPNMQHETYQARGLKEELRYHFTNRMLRYNVKNFGDLVNTVSPIHIKQDSFVHNVVSKFVKMDGEKEDYFVYGDTLMYAGVRLRQSYGGTGFNDEVRYFQDFGSRLYFMEAE